MGNRRTDLHLTAQVCRPHIHREAEIRDKGIDRLLSSRFRSYLEERVAQLVLSAHRLPGYALHPRATYRKLKDFGMGGIRHPRDLFCEDAAAIARVAGDLVKESSRRLAGTGFITGLPGGPLGIAAAVTIDLEEYMRRTFRMAQEVGHIFGLIPSPFADEMPSDTQNYFESAQVVILEAILRGLGDNADSSDHKVISRNIAGHQTRLVFTNKGRQKLMTELAMKIARLTGIHLAEGRIGRFFFGMIPIAGGGINALFCYMSMQKIGKSLISHFETEHRRTRSEVMVYWKNRASDTEPPLLTPH